jgi:hypothetical protein
MAGIAKLLGGTIRDEDISPGAAIARTKMAQRELAVIAVPLTTLRTWDAFATNLPASAGTDDLGLVTGTIATNPLTVQAGDSKATTVARYAGFQLALPLDYEAGQSLTVRIWAGMKTTVSDTTCTVDLETYLQNKDLTVTADLCATAAQSINSLTFNSYDFTITATTIDPGDVLYCRVKIACTDAATGTAVIPTITQIEALVDIR